MIKIVHGVNGLGGAIPERIEPKGISDYLEVMTKAVFQAGMRWAVIESKWSNFRRAFKEFDVAAIAAFSPDDIDRVANDPGIIRMRARVEATVENARMMLALEKEFGSFLNYLHAFPGYEQLSGDIKRRFRGVGELSAYYFLFRVREPVPSFEQWIITIPGNHPRMREMVDLARQQDAN